MTLTSVKEVLIENSDKKERHFGNSQKLEVNHSRQGSKLSSASKKSAFLNP